MRIYRESKFTFDFTVARDSVDHDKIDGDGNTFWDGVDFRVAEEGREVWIEVKNWRFKLMPNSAERLFAQRDFQGKLSNKTHYMDAFRDEIVHKFLGTTCYLAWARIDVPEEVYYVVLLDPPNRGSRALLLPFQDRLRDQFKNAQSRGFRIKCKAIDLQGFQQEFPDYPVSHY